MSSAWTPPWWWIVTDSGSGHVVDHLFMDPDEARRLLTDLRAAVPTRIVHDGGRTREEYLEPHEIDEPHLKEAALVLMLGELEVITSGKEDPDPEEVVWERLLAQVEPALDAANTSQDGERRDSVPLSEHLEEARSALKGIRFATAFARQKAKDEDELAFVRSVQTETAHLAFWLGWRMRALDQKPFDEAARTGIKVRAGARMGGEMSRVPRPETARVLATIDEALAAQEARGAARSVAGAAASAYRKGHGSSAAANAKLYRRHRRK